MNKDDRARFDSMEERIAALTELMAGAVGAVGASLGKLAESNDRMSALRKEVAGLADGLKVQQETVIQHALKLRETNAKARRAIEERLGISGGQHGEG